MSTAERADWKATTFSLSVADVAALLDMPQRSVVDLMTGGALGFWVPAVPDGARRGPTLMSARFDPADVHAYRDARPRTDLRALSAVLENLRDYLEARESTVSYARALSEGLPLRARGRLYVRTEALTVFAAERDAPAAAQMAGTTERVLKAVGAFRRRGIRPEGEARQRWAYWIRLPESVWDGSAPRSLGDLLAVAQTGPVPGEVPTGDGPAQPLPVDGEAWGEWEE